MRKERGKRDWKRVERGKRQDREWRGANCIRISVEFYIYIHQNNCIYITGIYKCQATFGEAIQKVERVELYMYIYQINYMYVTSIHMYLISNEQDLENEKRGERYWKREERSERERAESGEMLTVFVYLSYNCIFMCIVFI